MSFFDSLYSESAAGVFAELFGEDGVSYKAAAGSDDVTAIELYHVSVTDLMSERVNREDGEVVEEVRYFTVIVDPDHRYYCGHDTFEIDGRFTFQSTEYVIDQRFSANDVEHVYRCMRGGRKGVHSREFYGPQ